MELKLLKEKRKNESNEIYNKIDDLTEKISLFYEEFQQQRFQEDDTLNSNLSSNNFQVVLKVRLFQRINICYFEGLIVN